MDHSHDPLMSNDPRALDKRVECYDLRYPEGYNKAKVSFRREGSNQSHSRQEL